MSQSIHPQDKEEITHVGMREAEKMVGAVALRYGFRGDDYSIAWDGGKFDASLAEHELLIVRKDGQQAAARIANEALLRKDGWKYFRDVDEALAKLGRRTLTRGI